MFPSSPSIARRLAALLAALVGTWIAPASGSPLAAADAPSAGAARRPNILWLLSDDQRPDTIAALGNSKIRTPHLDELVRRGFVFKQAFCMGSTVPAVCLPSRCMMMTGMTLFRVPKGALNAEQAANTPLFPRTMGLAGYATLRSGKQGNHPGYADAAFDRNYDVPRSPTCSSIHAERAIEFIRSDRGGKPFAACIDFASPHDPRRAPQEYMDMYGPGDVGLPANYLPVHPFDNGEMTIRDEALLPWPRTEQAILSEIADYYSSITYMDAQIGRIVQALKDTGEFDRTIVVFTSDHGLAIGSHGLLGKQNLYEDGMGVPLVFAGPGIPAGRSSDALAYLLDIYPTLCDLVGAPIPERVEGKSLAPILQGRAEKVRDTLFTAYRGVQRAVRDDRWKLIRYPQVDRTQLFDLQTDPGETKDLSADPQHAKKVEELTALLARWQKDLADEQPLKVDAPKDPRWTPPAPARSDPKKSKPTNPDAGTKKGKKAAK